MSSWKDVFLSGSLKLTFANLFYGSDTLANRTQVVNDQLLDDGIFALYKPW